MQRKSFRWLKIQDFWKDLDKYSYIDLDSDHFDQYLKYSACEKADEILTKHPQIKHFYNNALPAALIISRRKADLVDYVRSYLQEKDPSLIVRLTVIETPPWNLSYFLIVKFCIFQDFW